ncbi:hypothetical protein ES705_50133 [subsurface metagenome]
MMDIKCIGCYDLLREEMTLEGRQLVVYNCPRFFPYACAISGLLRPGKGILQAVEACPEQPGQHCIFCDNTDVTHYGELPLATCGDHYGAWSAWLDKHQERKYLHPKGRLKKANWIEVFREFVEDMRRQTKVK